MTENITQIRDDILKAWLPSIEKQGWRWSDSTTASIQAGYQNTMADAVFPDGITGVVGHFADMIDRQMMEQLQSVSLDNMRVRDKIKTAVLARLDSMAEQHSAIKPTLAFWATPRSLVQGQQLVWRSADRIWIWAGDQSQDYNRHTKRALLSSILVTTTLVWLEDETEDHSKTSAFLDRRIENVMTFGKTLAQIGSKKDIFLKRPFKS